MLSKYDNCMPLLNEKQAEIGCFANEVGKNSQYFVGIFPGKSALCALLAICHLISRIRPHLESP